MTTRRARIVRFRARGAAQKPASPPVSAWATRPDLQTVLTGTTLTIGLALLLGGPPTAPAPRPTSGPAQWQRFESPEGGFAIEMPGKPEYRQVRPTSGKPAIVFHAFVVTRPQVQLIAGFIDLCPDIVKKNGPEKAIGMFIGGFMSGIGADQMTRKPLKIAGLTAFEHTILKADGKTARVLSVMRGSRAWHVVAATNRPDVEMDVIRRAFGSFEVLD